MDTGSPSYVGKARGIIPFINFHLLNNKKPFNLDLRLGLGAAYLEKIYDEEKNRLNQSISQHINPALNLRISANYKYNFWKFSAGAGLTHFSNGSFHMPNYGLNIVTFSAGASYSFGNEKRFISSSSDTYNSKEWKKSILLSGGMREILPIGGDKYLAGGICFELSKKHLDFTRFIGVVDIIYDGSDFDDLALSENPPENRWETVRFGMGVGYQVIFGKVSVIANPGIYLYSKNKSVGIIYQRTGIRYQITDQITAQTALRYQRGIAQFIEIGLGYDW